MKTQLLDAIPLWGLLLLTLVILWLGVEGGYRLGRWRRNTAADEKEQPVGAMVGSILGLVALVLGFTFSLAASRFDARRMAVLEEANAIGTTYLRTRLLSEPQRSETARLLRQYVDVRLSGVQDTDPTDELARSEALHELLFAQAEAAAERNEGSIMTGLFIQSLNDTIDMHAKRVQVGIRSRVPPVIWAGVFGLAALGMTAVGYQAGLSATRRSPAMICLVFAFSFVLMLIADLDRGQEGLLQVGQHAMIDLQRSMQPTEQ